MRKLKFKLDRISLEIIYVAFIRRLLEYADVIWDNRTLYEKQELEKIQNEAVRFATGTTKLVSLVYLHNEIKLESSEKRRRSHKHTILYNVHQLDSTVSFGLSHLLIHSVFLFPKTIFFIFILLNCGWC